MSVQSSFPHPSRPPSGHDGRHGSKREVSGTRVLSSQYGPPRFFTPPLPAGGCLTLEEYHEWMDERLGEGSQT